MSNPIWESLPKNQTDSTTILEAIANLIAEHNNDPDAHNLADQSLYLHRQNEILDHLAGSVKNDKNSFSDYVYNIHFSDFTYWVKSLFSLNSYDMSASVSLSSTNTQAYMRRELPVTSDLNSINCSWIIASSIIIDLPSSGTNYAFFGIGGYDANSYPDFGFVFKGGHVYLSYYSSFTSDFVLIDLSHDEVYDGNRHHFRVEYIKSENVVNYYLDGQLVYTLHDDTDEFVMWNDDPFFVYGAKRSSTGTSYIDMSVYQPFLSLDYTY